VVTVSIAWHVREGDRLEEDQLMAEVITDKATVEMIAPAAGLVAALHRAGREICRRRTLCGVGTGRRARYASRAHHTGGARSAAERMQEANRNTPHLTYIEEVNMTALNARRTEDQPKLTLLPFLMGVLVKTLPRFPQFNTHYNGEAGVLR